MTTPNAYVFDAASVDAKSALLNGWVQDGSQKVRVVAEEVIEAGNLPTRIAFRRSSENPPSRIKSYFSSIRALSLTATVVPGLAVLFMGLSAGFTPNFNFFILALLGVLFLQVGVNVLNDYEDHLKLIDLPGTAGGSQTLQRGWVSARELRTLGYLSLGMGVLFGLPIVVTYWRAMLVLAVFAFAGSLGYSSRPFGLKYRAMGDLDVFLLCGPLLTFGFSLATFGEYVSGVTYLGVFFGLLACGILHVNNIQDIVVDTKRGAKTLASVLGFKKSKIVLSAYYGIAYSVLLFGFIAGALPLSSLFAFLALGIFVSLLFKCRKASGPHSPHLNGLRVMASKGHLVAGLAMVIAMGVVTFI
jgi:1,4-dihydroxy-2-naphthoate polyprenyltransferase